MKLIYSPYYNQDLYLGKDRIIFNQKRVGDNGLLAELELRAGITSTSVSQASRVVSYAHALSKCADAPTAGNKPFYALSLGGNEIATAAKLLSWRDSLVMAGWNAFYSIPSDVSDGTVRKLHDLAEVEKLFKMPGVGDRWQAVLAHARKHGIDGVDIVLDMRRDLVNPVISAVLDAIEDHRAGSVTISEEAAALIEGYMLGTDAPSKTSFYAFGNQIDACQWGLKNHDSGDLVICDDAATLSGVTSCFGEQPVGGSTDGDIPLVEQLLKIGLSLFTAPVDISALKNYLNLSCRPVMTDGLAGKLLNHISSTGGFGKNIFSGESWDSLVGNNAEPCLNMWKKNTSGGVKVLDMKEYCKALAKWADGKNCGPDVALRTHLDTLSELCSAMISWLEGLETKDVDVSRAMQVASSLTSPAPSYIDTARMGCREVVKDITAIATHVDNAVWMDCIARPARHYAYDFINPTDIARLVDLLIETPSLATESYVFAIRLGFSRCGNLDVLVPVRTSGEKCSKSLFCYLYDATVGSTMTPSLEDTSTLKGKTIAAHVEADQQLAEHHVTRTEKTSEPRKEESYSSMSMLLAEPFDYVMHYLHGMKDSFEGNLETIKGTVAHAFIEEIVDRIKGADEDRFVSAVEFEKEFNSVDKDALLDVIMYDFGAELLLPENVMDVKHFRTVLFDRSIPNLIKILADNNLKICWCERPMKRTLPDASNGEKGFLLDARIDMIVQDSETKKYGIFDFKWTGNPNRRIEEIENGRELQLELYRKIAEIELNASIDLKGYFLLKQACYVTDYTRLAPSDYVRVVPKKVSVDLYGQALKTYNLRLKDLLDGNDVVFEEGDEMKAAKLMGTSLMDAMLAETAATQEPSAEYFVPEGLKTKYTKKTGSTSATGKKKDASYGRNAILKGRLK